MSLKKITLSSLLAASTISSAFAMTDVIFMNGITDSNYTVSVDSLDSNVLDTWDTLNVTIGAFSDDSTIYVQNNNIIKGIIRVQDSHVPCSYDADLGTFYNNANSFWWIDLYNNGSYAGKVCAPIGSDLSGHVSLGVYKVAGVNDSFQAKLWVTGLLSESVTIGF